MVLFDYIHVFVSVDKTIHNIWNFTRSLVNNEYVKRISHNLL